MKMHWAEVLDVLRAATAAETVLYVPEPPTDRQPAGGEVRPARATSEVGAAAAAAVSERTSASKWYILRKEY